MQKSENVNKAFPRPNGRFIWGWLSLLGLLGACAAPPLVEQLAEETMWTVAAPPSGVATWTDLYDPFVLRSFHIRIHEDDLAAIRADATFDLKRGATFWFEGEEERRPITIRRKSATPIGDKVSYRVAFDQSLFGTIRSFSLENGDDQDVVSEGLSWYLHRLAASDGYQPGLAAWATLTFHVERSEVGEEGLPLIEVQEQGVYLNVELPDKRFVARRALGGQGGIDYWLYKQDDIGLPELKEPEGGAHSPLYEALDFVPFRTAQTSGRRVVNLPPSDPELEQLLRSTIDIDAWLRLGAVNAYTDNPDELFNKGKNFFWIDRADGLRGYLPWDLDAAIRSTSAGIYGTLGTGRNGKSNVSQHPFQEVILNHPRFRVAYNRLFLELLDGPLGAARVEADLVAFEHLLGAALAADPNSKIDDVAAHFASLRAWVAAREVSVRQQVAANDMPAPRPDYVDEPGDGIAPVSVRLASLSGSTTLLNRNQWSATATATVAAMDATPQSGATVALRWEGAATGSGTCTTDATGACDVTVGGLRSNRPSITFTAFEVTGPNLLFDGEILSLTLTP
jgi:hypothetical protein